MTFLIRRISIILVLLFAGVLLWSTCSAEAQTFHVSLNPTQTKIHFTLGAVLHKVHGSFTLKSGEMDFSIATGKAEGVIVVAATSGESGNESRDHKMHATVLESAKYSQIVFVPQNLEGKISLDGVSQVQIQGIMQIHGVERAITVPVETQIRKGQVTATLHFDIPYVQWGMNDPSTFILRVAKSVSIEVQAVGAISAVRE